MTLDQLQQLQPNWDGEGADVPSPQAIEDAQKIIDWLNQKNILIESIDADVLGGIAIYIGEATGENYTWISILNSGDRTVINKFLDINLLQELKTNFNNFTVYAGGR